MIHVDTAALINNGNCEKMLLAKRIGKFLEADQVEEQRRVVEAAAWWLANDVSLQVRQVLAYELRRCDELKADLAEKMARDVEAVACTFLQKTLALSDEQLVNLIPELPSHSWRALAARADLGEAVLDQLVQAGDEPCMTCLLDNEELELAERHYGTMVDRFNASRGLMEQIGEQSDLPISIVERLVDKVSEACRLRLIEKHAVSDDLAAELATTSKIEVLWRHLRGADASQIHTCVIDLRANGSLNHLLVIEMAKKGCWAFLESALALESGYTIACIREILTLQNPRDFVSLMECTGVSKELAPWYLRLAKRHEADALVA